MFDEKTAPLGIALLRVTMGILLLMHGPYLKLVVFGIDGTVGFFESIGFPGALAYLTILAETLGGIALLIGFQTRWAALAVLPVLLGATYVHLGNGWVFSAQGGGFEYPLFWTIALVAQSLLGDGAYAVKPSFGLQRSANQAA